MKDRDVGKELQRQPGLCHSSIQSRSGSLKGERENLLRGQDKSWPFSTSQRHSREVRGKRRIIGDAGPLF